LQLQLWIHPRVMTALKWRSKKWRTHERRDRAGYTCEVEFECLSARP
jgi:hypothetical protein